MLEAGAVNASEGGPDAFIPRNREDRDRDSLGYICRSERLQERELPIHKTPVPTSGRAERGLPCPQSNLEPSICTHSFKAGANGQQLRESLRGKEEA